MNLRSLSVPAVSVLATILLVPAAFAQSRPAEQASPYGGQTVEEIIARINDQIITRSDYDRAMKELDDEARKNGATMQQISEAHKDLLRSLIDQQLWLYKGKELGVTGETELINRLDEIRKQYNLSSLEDLEKAAQEQGISFEDFKANIRNHIITEQVMRDEVGRHISFTPGEVERYFEQHKESYVQPESLHLGEILVGTPADADDAAVAAAKAKADGIVAKVRGGANFAELARTSSEGTTAAEGGEMGTYKRGQLAPVFENATFGLKAGEVTDPIRTRQGFVIFKVVQHIPGGAPNFKDVEQQVEQDYYDSKMEPAIRDYLTKMREDAFIEIKPGLIDTGASTNKRVNPISYAAYVPPAPKKKAKVERTRYRENTHFRSKVAMPEADTSRPEQKPQTGNQTGKKTSANRSTLKPGKKEKIRFGKAPTKTLPSGAAPATENAGANPQLAQNNQPEAPEPAAAPPVKKSRFSDRARTGTKRQPKVTKVAYPSQTPASAPDAAEVADRQTQSAPLGLSGDSTKKKKKTSTTTSQKTRLSKKKQQEQQSQGPAAPAQPTPIPPVPGAPAPAQPQQQTPAPAPATQPAPPQQ